MAIASLVFGVLAMIGYVGFFFVWGGSPMYFWCALAASAIAAGLGYLARPRPYSRAGLALGIAGLVIAAGLTMWLTLDGGGAVSRPI